MAEMAPIYNYENIQKEKYKKEHGVYPPPGPIAKQLMVTLPEDKQYDALRKYLGFK